MQVFFTDETASLTGFLDKTTGYAIRKQKNGLYYGKRNSKGHVPLDGHLRFIFQCAQMAKRHFLIGDIRVKAPEMQEALEEAHKYIAAQMVWENYVNYKKRDYNAADVLNLKTTFGL